MRRRQRKIEAYTDPGGLKLVKEEGGDKKLTEKDRNLY